MSFLIFHISETQATFQDEQRNAEHDDEDEEKQQHRAQRENYWRKILFFIFQLNEMLQTAAKNGQKKRWCKNSRNEQASCCE